MLPILAVVAAAAVATFPVPPSKAPLALDLPETAADGALTVTSKTFAANTMMPFDQSSYGPSKSPALAWSKGPRQTVSYALIMEDSGAAYQGKPILHWAAFNIAGTSLPEALPSDAVLTAPVAMAQGLNIRGHAGYMGPRTPFGAGKHAYHFEVFALDATLDTAAGANRDALVAAMKGHVVARGDLVGFFEAPTPPPAAPAAAPNL